MTKGNDKADFSDGGFGETLSKIKAIESDEEKAYEAAAQANRERLAKARAEADSMMRAASEEAARIRAEAHANAASRAKAEADALRARAEEECGRIKSMKPPNGLAEELAEMTVS